LGIALFAACHTSVSVKKREITDYFQLLPPTDTIHAEISAQSDSIVAGDTIPNRLFFSTLPSAFLQEIDYVADSSAAVVLGRYYFALNDSITAYWVEIRQFWFQHHSLLLYSLPQKRFTERITLAEWYGGDGGQNLIGSWLFDYDGDGQKDIVRQSIAHSMIPVGDDVKELTEPSVSLLLGKHGHFTAVPVADSANLIRRFPIRSAW